jgi:hypothetical protein
MSVKLLSLAYVRMAVKRTNYVNMWAYAVTRDYQPSVNWDGTKLYGACVIADVTGDRIHIKGDIA